MSKRAVSISCKTWKLSTEYKTKQWQKVTRKKSTKKRMKNNKRCVKNNSYTRTYKKNYRTVPRSDVRTYCKQKYDNNFADYLEEEGRREGGSK